MDDSGTVDLVFQNKPFRNISKTLLESNCEYFRGLFSGNFSDSSLQSYDFDLSPKGFSIVLQYMKNKEINLKRQTQTHVLINALKIAEFLCIDCFEKDFRETLLDSSGDLDTQLSLELASYLNIDRIEYEGKCLQLFTSYSNSRAFSYEFLSLVTNQEIFWKIDRSHYCYDFFWNMTNLIEKVLSCALKNPPNKESMLSLIKNLKLESVPWNSLKRLLYYITEIENRRVALMLGVQHHFSDLRDRICNKISAIRVCFKKQHNKNNDLGVIEFDLDKWSWVVRKEIKTHFKGKFCVMSRDYANIFGETGQLTFRMSNYNPKIVENLYVGEMSRWVDSYDPSISACVSGSSFYFFVYHPHSGSHLINQFAECMWYSRPTLFKLGVFDQEFSECTTLPVLAASVVAEGSRVYIAGSRPDASNVIQVFVYYTTTGAVRKVVEFKTKKELYVAQPKLVLKKNLLYIFFNQTYWIVDTRAGLKQPLSEMTLECFFTQGWDFKILQLCSVDDGIVFLLDIEHRAHNCDYLGMMLAFLNTETCEFMSLGFLPNPTVEYQYNLLLNSLQVQIERRLAGAGNFTPSKPFPEGIQDLENLPHRHSSMYF